ncbi:carbohydrate sulfotransferase 11-like isoform X2 [Centruroides vittatus]|uniref:carbohydrate sulfotransferase 11-like isoform X2 n=1 Tax=Centruroides vittatus TaxID=120091 RepID=UPI00350E9B26
MLSTQHKRHWIKCLCSSILLIAIATWIIYLFLPTPTKGPKFKNISHTYSSTKVRITLNTQAIPTTLDSSLPSDIYESRLDRVNEVCDKYSIPYYRIFKKATSNRLKNDKRTSCTTKQCPVLVDDDNLFYFCFIPKVASTFIKQLFYNISSLPHNFSVSTNSSAFHSEANEVFKRISPLLYPKYILRRYYKVMFVRHPFDRLVSAFRDKAEKSRKEKLYFYEKYWDPIMKKYRSSDKLDDNSKPTFREFTRYLLETNPSHYDNHWAFYWSRCEPCLVQYDFIGKLESAQEDFWQVSRKLDIDYLPFKVKKEDRFTNRNYFYNLTAEELSKLYSLYKLDFELFDYTIEEFFGTSNYNQSLRKLNSTA